MIKSIMLFLLAFYRKWISPLKPPTCRFYPTCSQYAVEAIERYGPLTGILLSVKRLFKCGPWHPGGFDPVPLKEQKGSHKEGTL
ncbi:putative membrane protein insertion efficiency factor [Collibacillus ludicampi]|uniref:Putative membrane protein insertion efficiency factor n=1 Tax=Collibacillus ludicampi TaxID=2771369 RepID=A0AAV4LEM8_9BACL|nr:membrane protein insertion efficiency factor YidD [Collibacillus ludicampi]GIM45897.1 putative membrane protein insertion efficiency factor [Collibacillus ludicampi]